MPNPRYTIHPPLEMKLLDFYRDCGMHGTVEVYSTGLHPEVLRIEVDVGRWTPLFYNVVYHERVAWLQVSNVGQLNELLIRACRSS